MTLQPHTPQHLDTLALEVLDLASSLRKMSIIMQENEIESLPLHGRKPSEWLAKLTEWSHKNEAELQRELLHRQAIRRAEATTAQQSKAGTVKSKRNAKT